MVDGFTGSGFRVVRLDNRDIGRSSVIGTRSPGRLRQLLARPRPDAYDLADMAADTYGLLEHLGPTLPGWFRGVRGGSQGRRSTCAG